MTYFQTNISHSNECFDEWVENVEAIRKVAKQLNDIV
jgi:hypothetical protein